MPTPSETRQLVITLPTRLADEVQAKVASGEFASESDVVQEGLLHLSADPDAARHGMSTEEFEAWLRAEALPALEDLDAEPSRGLTIEQVRAHLAETHKNFQKAG